MRAWRTGIDYGITYIYTFTVINSVCNNRNIATKNASVIINAVCAVGCRGLLFASLWAASSRGSCQAVGAHVTSRSV